MTEKGYTLSYLFLVLRVRNLAPKKQVTATLKKNQKERKKKSAVLERSTRVLA